MKNLYRAHKFGIEAPLSGRFDNPYLHIARKPVTTPLGVHQACDAWYQARFHSPFRSGSLFGTGNLEQAKKYLDKQAVLLKFWPIGPFKICYSPLVYDLFEHFTLNFSGQQLTPESVTAELENMGYVCYENDGLQTAAESNCEVMLIADVFGYEVLSDTA
jgi:hypothetical protein